jgi:voltage-dependent potassium channel beta subunit
MNLTMEYRRLGKSGLKVSTLSFGSWVTFGQQIGDDVAEGCMVAAYEAGVNFFDNAEAYAGGKSELVMGNILKKLGWSRDTFIVSSKVFWGGDLPTQEGLSRKHVTEACHAALKRLQVDYLDLYFCHRPDESTPIEETVDAMTNLIRQGKVLYWGTSEWSAQQIMEAYAAARQYNLTPPTMEQPQYHMLHRERVEQEYRRLYSEIGLGTTIWSPLASGLLSGKYNDATPADTRINLPGYEWLKRMFESEDGRQKLEKVRQLGVIAADLGVSMPHLALAWCAKNPNVSTIITGASKVEQVKENMKALEAVPLLTPEVMERISGVLG